MIDVAMSPAIVQASFVVITIFALAVILFVGYGALKRAAEPLIETISDT